MHLHREVAIWEGIAEKYQEQVESWWGIYKKKEVLKNLILQSKDPNPIGVGAHRETNGKRRDGGKIL